MGGGALRMLNRNKASLPEHHQSNAAAVCTAVSPSEGSLNQRSDISSWVPLAAGLRCGTGHACGWRREYWNKRRVSTFPEVDADD